MGLGTETPNSSNRESNQGSLEEVAATTRYSASVEEPSLIYIGEDMKAKRGSFLKKQVMMRCIFKIT